MSSLSLRLCALAFFMALFVCVQSHAVHHVMQIEMVIGSVNGYTDAQAIQLRMRSIGQNLLSGSRLKAYDAARANPVLLFDFNSAVSNGSTGDRVLLTTTAFDALTTPNCQSDFTLTNRIPDSYFTAGCVTFEEDDGTILWMLSWGASGFTGSTLGDDENDADGNFGPPSAVSLVQNAEYPVAAVAHQFTGAANALSTTNLDDYFLNAAALVTNNDDEEFAVDGGPKSITVTKPNAGSHADTGGTLDIRWNFTGNISKKVRIDLFRGTEKIDTIVKKTKYNRKFTWDVPSDLDDGSNYRVRVLDKHNGVSDKSDAFTVETH